MTIRWTHTALGDIESLHDYIAADDPTAAISMVDAIEDAVELLRRHPDLGRKGRVPGTRELVVAPYVVAYRISQSWIEVLAVIHGARRWPGSF